MQRFGITASPDPETVIATAEDEVERVDEVRGLVDRDEPARTLWNYSGARVYTYDPGDSSLQGYDAEAVLGDRRLGVRYDIAPDLGDFYDEFQMVLFTYDLREFDEPFRGDGPVHLGSPENDGLEIYADRDALEVEAPAAHLDIFAVLDRMPGVEPVEHYLAAPAADDPRGR